MTEGRSMLARKKGLVQDLRALLLHEDSWNEEQIHIDADKYLLDYIDDVHVSQAFHDINKWYS